MLCFNSSKMNRHFFYLIHGVYHHIAMIHSLDMLLSSSFLLYIYLKVQADFAILQTQSQTWAFFHWIWKPGGISWTKGLSLKTMQMNQPVYTQLYNRGWPSHNLPFTCPIVPMQMSSARVNGSQASCWIQWKSICIPIVPSFNLFQITKFFFKFLPSRKR